MPKSTKQNLKIYLLFVVLFVTMVFIAQADSVVSVVADEAGLQLLSPDAVPFVGTFWTVIDGSVSVIPPFPSAPLNASLPVYKITEEQFLVDDTAGDSGMSAASLSEQADSVSNLIVQIQTSAASHALGLRAMDDSDPPLPGGAGSGDSGSADDVTNSFQGQVFTTNDLWLQILSVTNDTANLVIHPPWNEDDDAYDLFYTTNLLAPVDWSWVLRTTAGQTNVAAANATGAQGFYRISSPNDLAANDSQGTNFWFMFYAMSLYQIPGYYTNLLSVYISSPIESTGTVTIPGLGFTNAFSISGGAMVNIPIPINAMTQNYDVIQTNAINVVASQPVSVYALDYVQAATATFTAYPTTMLGTNYCVMARESDIDGDNSQFSIVATESNTTVNITPSATAGLNGHAGFYSVTNLQPGETYQINSGFFTEDVTGTQITSDKPIGVFAGANSANVQAAYGNPLVQEQLPIDDWSTNYVALSFGGRVGGDTFRVLADYTNTTVTMTTSNGTQDITLQAGSFYETIITGTVQFQANLPIQVAQFANGSTFDPANDSQGDPGEILIPASGQYLESYMFFALSEEQTDFTKDFFTLIVPQSALTSTFVDGSAVSTNDFIPIGNSNYYGAELPIAAGVHSVSSSQPVELQIYGYGIRDAYYYLGGLVE